MSAPEIFLAILAGGSGTRFWPTGRRSRPKQVLPLDGDDPRPLLVATVERVGPLSKAPPWILAPQALLPTLRRPLPDLPKEAFLAEPAARNTAAAVVLAAEIARRRAPKATALVVPADHHVRPAGRYRRALRAMASRARRAGTILTLGLAPDRPATGYGYLRMGEHVESRPSGEVLRVDRYIEKPPPRKARRLANDGHHLWNGGTFAFLPEVFLAEAARLLPAVAEPLARACTSYGTRRFRTALANAYAELPSISVDCGIMERARGVETVAADIAWDDLGSWDAVARHRQPDTEGNRVRGDATLLDARDCVVDAAAGHVALLGVEGLIVVRTKDTVLVMPRGEGERVKDLVERLEQDGREELLR